jgi:hypothetical protein
MMPLVTSTELARHAGIPLEDLLLAVDLGLLRGAVRLHDGRPHYDLGRALQALGRALALAERVKSGQMTVAEALRRDATV